MECFGRHALPHSRHLWLAPLGRILFHDGYQRGQIRFVFHCARQNSTQYTYFGRGRPPWDEKPPSRCNRLPPQRRSTSSLDRPWTNWEIVNNILRSSFTHDHGSGTNAGRRSGQSYYVVVFVPIPRLEAFSTTRVRGGNMQITYRRSLPLLVRSKIRPCSKGGQDGRTCSGSHES